MKILARENTHRYRFVIEIEFTDESYELDNFSEFEITAGELVNHPKNKNIAKKYLLNEEQLMKLDTLVCGVKSFLDGFNFNIVKQWQSDDSYSYYFVFRNEFEDEFEFEFRVSDHIQGKDVAKISYQKNFIRIIRQIILGGKEFKSITSALRAIKHFCESIQSGDVDALLQEYKEADE